MNFFYPHFLIHAKKIPCTWNLQYKMEIKMDIATTKPQPQVAVHGWTKDEIEIELTNVHISVAATMRAMITHAVPMLAIDAVQVEWNNSCLDTYALARTLEFVRLRCSEKFKKGLAFAGQCSSCTDFQCDACSVKLELNVECKEAGAFRMVTSDDLVVLGTDAHKREVQVCQPPQPIVALSQDQRIVLTAYARKGLGHEHAKYLPTANNVSIRTPAIVHVDRKLHQQLSTKQQARLRNSCPTGVLDDIENLKPDKCTKCNACVDVAHNEFQQPQLVRIDEEPRYFLYVRAKPSIAPETIVHGAFGALLTKLNGGA
jgi:DNA-directed RNA polymerase alpha subunit